MRSSHDSNIRNSRSPNFASIFSRRNTAATFSSSTEPEKSSSATDTRNSRSCSRKISRRQRRTARRNSAVYQPCDLISSLKNHCTPEACWAEPPSLRIDRISVAIAAELFLALGIFLREDLRLGTTYSGTPLVLTNLSYIQRPAAVAIP